MDIEAFWKSFDKHMDAHMASLQHDAHVDDYLVNLDEESDRRAWEAREEEDARAYLGQKPIMLSDCKED